MKKASWDLFLMDYGRYGEKFNFFRFAWRVMFDSTLRFILYNRLKWRFLARRLGKKYGLEMSLDNIGGGLSLHHPHCITINPSAHIGEYATIFKGVTIGSVRSGKQKGAPTIGDRVSLMPNCSVVGGITIGDDVLVAANAFVNRDVPPDSIVIGNPMIIKPKNDPSADYLGNLRS